MSQRAALLGQIDKGKTVVMNRLKNPLCARKKGEKRGVWYLSSLFQSALFQGQKETFIGTN